MQEFQVFQGKGTAKLSLPDRWSVFNVPMPEDVPLPDPKGSVLEKLARPLGCQPLSREVGPGTKVALAVTDVSRPCPDYLLVPPILKELEKAGVAREDVTILIGVGEHRPVTPQEMIPKFGREVVDNYRIINHNARDRENLIDLGKTAEGVPQVVNALFGRVDYIITLGVVDLHQYAGFSGGAKTVSVGCAGEESIKYTHSADFLDRSGAVPGNVEGNLFQEALWEIAKPFPLKFGLNVILNEKGEILEMEAGDPRTVHRKLIDIARKKFIYYVDQQFDGAFLGVPHPKDVNLYQATRAVTYQSLSGRSIFRKGAVLNLIASCPEGFGQGTGEGRFRAKMESGTPEEVLAELTGKKSLPGEQRAFMVVKTMVSNPINVFGTGIPAEDLEGCSFLCNPLVPEEDAAKDLSVLVMKDGMKKVVLLKE
jgi:nickel-dependent lactate racemase